MIYIHQVPTFYIERNLLIILYYFDHIDQRFVIVAIDFDCRIVSAIRAFEFGVRSI
jgi:hypothetical protein